MSKYYYINLSHARSQDNVLIFWSPNHSGYTKAYERAGVYDTPYSMGDFVHGEIHHEQLTVEKELIDSLVVELKLGEKYAGLNSFHVLPNIGRIRKALGITIFDFRMNGANDSFWARFEDTVFEKEKQIIHKNIYHVKAKEYVEEFWYLDGFYEAENRNKAILKAYNDWIPADYNNYIEFKKDVTCRRKKETVFDRWSDDE